MLPSALMTELNRAVLAHVADLSAHSDIADVLLNAVKPLGDVHLFCPDWNAYRYVIASTKGVIFGLAVGMDTVAFRLDAKMKGRALETGGVDCPHCGENWVAILHHRTDSDWPAVDAGFWARKAYLYARESS